MNRNELKEWWEYIQSLLDIDGDVWMALFTGCIIWRIYGGFRGGPGLNMAEASVYCTAAGAFAYSNTGKPKP